MSWPCQSSRWWRTLDDEITEFGSKSFDGDIEIVKAKPRPSPLTNTWRSVLRAPKGGYRPCHRRQADKNRVGRGTLALTLGYDGVDWQRQSCGCTGHHEPEDVNKRAAS